MKKLGRKQLILHLQTAISTLPAALNGFSLQLSDDGKTLTYDYFDNQPTNHVTEVLAAIHRSGIALSDVKTKQSTLEQIFVSLVTGVIDFFVFYCFRIGYRFGDDRHRGGQLWRIYYSGPHHADGVD